MKNTNKNIDRENLRSVILDFPNQFEIGFKIAKDIQTLGNFNSIAISGMGGSCLPGDILRDYLLNKNETNLEIIQNRTYSLPKKAYKNSLNFFISYSGNTEETISSLEEAINNNLPSIGFASGGKLVEICQKNDIPYVIVPQGIQPRYATGYFFSAMIQVLKNCNLIQENLEEIASLSQNLKNEQENLEKKGFEIAKKFKNKTPIIYTTDKYKSLAMIIKIKINENSKTPAFWNYFPELNHNEMVGFTLPQGKFSVLTFIDPEENTQNIKRMKITASLYEEKNVETILSEIKGNTPFEKIFSTLLLGDWISYYLALAYNQDPTPVEMVENLKKQLS